MIDVPAGASSRHSDGGNGSPAYLLIQAAIVLACLLSLTFRLPDPDDRYRLSEALLATGGAQVPIQLPYHEPAEVASDAPRLFMLRFDRPANAVAEAWSVFVPRFIRGIEVAVNGAESSTAAGTPPPTDPTATPRRS